MRYTLLILLGIIPILNLQAQSLIPSHTPIGKAIYEQANILLQQYEYTFNHYQEDNSLLNTFTENHLKKRGYAKIETTDDYGYKGSPKTIGTEIPIMTYMENSSRHTLSYDETSIVVKGDTSTIVNDKYKLTIYFEQEVSFKHANREPIRSYREFSVIGKLLPKGDGTFEAKSFRVQKTDCYLSN